MGTYEDNLEKARVLIYGVTGDAAIKERIAAVYPEERLTSGITLYQNTRSAFASQKKEKNESENATKAFNDARTAVQEKLSKLREGIRYFYKNDLITQKQLLIGGVVPAKYAEWILFADNSFKAVQANTDAVAKLSILGFTDEVLVECLSQLAQVEVLRLAAEKEDGEAQQATVQKTELLSQLEEYCSDLRECLGLFYTGNERQKLEEVGIIIK